MGPGVAMSFKRERETACACRRRSKFSGETVLASWSFGAPRRYKLYVYQGGAFDGMTADLLAQAGPEPERRYELAEEIVELWTHRALLASSRRTEDPSQADVFFVPAYLSLSRRVDRKSHVARLGALLVPDRAVISRDAFEMQSSCWQVLATRPTALGRARGEPALPKTFGRGPRLRLQLDEPGRGAGGGLPNAV